MTQDGNDLLTVPTATLGSDSARVETPRTEAEKEKALEEALRALAAVDVPDALTASILAKTADAHESVGFLGFGRRQWVFAGASFGIWAVAMQGVFSWMLGGLTSL